MVLNVETQQTSWGIFPLLGVPPSLRHGIDRWLAKVFWFSLKSTRRLGNLKTTGAFPREICDISRSDTTEISYTPRHIGETAARIHVSVSKSDIHSPNFLYRCALRFYWVLRLRMWSAGIFGEGCKVLNGWNGDKRGYGKRCKGVKL